ncbi:MAG: tetratricopeptide repeat protein [Cyanobacteriota bacterium]|nr:tetratricopeptide repeat protein [Cyanobacteriota bacterium]
MPSHTSSVAAASIVARLQATPIVEGSRLRCSLKADTLHLLMEYGETDPPPPQQVVKQLVEQLRDLPLPPEVEQVIIYGRPQGQQQPAWRQSVARGSLDPHPTQLVPSESPPDPISPEKVLASTRHTDPIRLIPPHLRPVPQAATGDPPSASSVSLPRLGIPALLRSPSPKLASASPPTAEESEPSEAIADPVAPSLSPTDNQTDKEGDPQAPSPHRLVQTIQSGFAQLQSSFSPYLPPLPMLLGLVSLAGLGVTLWLGLSWRQAQQWQAVSQDYHQGVDFARQGRWQQAIDRYETALQQDPHNLAVQVALEHAQGRLAELEERIRQQRSQLIAQPQNIEARLDLAIALYQKGDWQQAQQELATTLAQAPQNPQAHYYLGLTHAAQAQWDPARQSYQRALQADPRYADAHAQIGVVYLKQDQPEQAIPPLHQAIALDPNHALAHYQLGLAYSRTANPEAAVDFYLQAMQLDPTYASAVQDLGSAFYAEGQMDQAIRTFRAALQQNPRDPQTHLNLGKAYFAHNQLAEAEKSFRQAIRHDPRLLEAHLQLGRLLSAQGEWSAAIASLESALALDPNHALTQHYLGIALAEQAVLADAPLDQAIAQLNRALTQDPKRAETHLNLGLALLQTEQTNQAVEHLQTAVALDPENSQARHTLGLALAQQQNYGAALSQFNAALDHNPLQTQTYASQSQVLTATGQSQQAQASQTIATRLPQPASPASTLADQAEQKIRANLSRLQDPTASLPDSLKAPTQPAVAPTTSGATPPVATTAQAFQSVPFPSPTPIPTLPPAPLAVATPIPATPLPAPPPVSVATPAPPLATALAATPAPAPPSLVSSTAGVESVSSHPWRQILPWGLGVGLGIPALLVLGRTLQKALSAARPTVSSTGLGGDRASRHFGQALTLIQENQWDPAILELQQAIEVNPRYAAAYQQWGYLLFRKGRFQEAIPLFRQAEQINPDLEGLSTQLLDTLMEYGQQLLTQKDPHEAVSQFRAANAIATTQVNSPKAKKAQIHVCLGKAFLQQRLWIEAKSEFQQALIQDPSLASAYCGAGYALCYQGERELAIDMFEKALGINPNLPEAHHGTGVAFFLLGQLRPAIASLRTAVEKATRPQPDFHVDLGLALLQTGDVVNAAQEFTKALTRDPNLARAHYGMGQVLMANKDNDEAIKKFELAHNLDHHFWAATACIGLAFLSQKQQDLSGKKFIHSRQAEAAGNKFETVVRKDPSVPEAHFGMGELFRIRGNLLFAVQHYQAAIKANGSYAAAHFRLGSIYAKLGQLDKAVEELRRAIDLNPDFPEAKTTLNRVLSRRSDDSVTQIIL